MKVIWETNGITGTGSHAGPRNAGRNVREFRLLRANRRAPQRCGARIETLRVASGPIARNDAPRSDAGRGLKRVGCRGSMGGPPDAPRSDAGRGLKHHKHGNDNIHRRDAPRSDAGRGLKPLCRKAAYADHSRRAPQRCGARIETARRDGLLRSSAPTRPAAMRGED